MASQQQLLVKCIFMDKESSREIRKFIIDRNEATKFVVVDRKIRALFPQLAFDDFRIYYIDEDGDKILVSSDEELLAFYATNQGHLVRLNVELLGKTTFTLSSRDMPELESCNGELHRGIVCNVCESEIRGFRYKCMKCDDYDLCGKCEASGHHPGHMMIRNAAPMSCFPKVLRAIKTSSATGTVVESSKSLFVPVTRGFESMHKNDEKAIKRDSTTSFSSEPQFNFRRERFTKAVEPSLGSFLESSGLFGKSCSAAAYDDQFKAAAHAAEVALAAQQAAAAVTAAATAAVDAALAAAQQTTDAVAAAAEEVKSRDVSAELNPEAFGLGNSREAADAAAAEAVRGGDLAVETNGEAAAIAAAEEEEQVERSSSVVSGEWMFVGGSKQNEEAAAGEHADVENAAAQLDNLDLESKQTSDEVCAELDVVGTSHPNFKIAEALNTMLSMGFTNEGGWLLHLLEVKNGNITKVLDVLHGLP